MIETHVSPRDPDLSVHLTAVVVFLEVDAVDRSDAAYIGSRAVKELIMRDTGDRVGRDTPILAFPVGPEDSRRVAVQRVEDLGIASANALVYTEVAKKAFPFSEDRRLAANSSLAD